MDAKGENSECYKANVACFIDDDELCFGEKFEYRKSEKSGIQLLGGVRLSV